MLWVRDLPQANLSALITADKNVPASAERQRNDRLVVSDQRFSEGRGATRVLHVPEADRALSACCK